MDRAASGEYDRMKTAFADAISHDGSRTDRLCLAAELRDLKELRRCVDGAFGAFAEVMGDLARACRESGLVKSDPQDLIDAIRDAGRKNFLWHIEAWIDCAEDEIRARCEGYRMPAGRITAHPDALDARQLGVGQHNRI